MSFFAFIIRLITVPAVYGLSFYAFKSTSLYTVLDSYFHPPLSSDGSIAALVFLLMLLTRSGKKNINGFIYLVCAVFYLPATFSYAKLNWVDLFLFTFDFKTSLPETGLALIGFFILAGCMIIHYTSYYKVEYDDLIARGCPRDEVNQALLKTGALLLLLFTLVAAAVSGFIYSTAFFEPWLKKLALSLFVSLAAIAAAALVIILLLGLGLLRGLKSSS